MATRTQAASTDRGKLATTPASPGNRRYDPGASPPRGRSAGPGRCTLPAWSPGRWLPLRRRTTTQPPTFKATLARLPPLRTAQPTLEGEGPQRRFPSRRRGRRGPMALLVAVGAVCRLYSRTLGNGGQPGRFAEVSSPCRRTNALSRDGRSRSGRGRRPRASASPCGAPVRGKRGTPVRRFGSERGRRDKRRAAPAGGAKRDTARTLAPVTCFDA
jgi:hypothetical protein